MLIDANRYSCSLKKLWIDTFGDTEDYVSLLFDKGYTPTECFGEIVNGEVVSVLYLLKGYIKSDKINYEGRYLYAAATAVPYRGKGLMAKLIKEAQRYIAEKGITFICLVPADEGLYGFYGRFGFEPLMKNYISLSSESGTDIGDNKENITLEEFVSLRENISDNIFSFGAEEWKYVYSCLRYAGYNLIRNSEDSYYIISDDGSEVLEYGSSAENYSHNTKRFLNRLKEGTTIVSPQSLSGFCESRENKFGMIYYAEETDKKNISGDIYMNIALD